MVLYYVMVANERREVRQYNVASPGATGLLIRTFRDLPPTREGVEGWFRARGCVRHEPRADEKFTGVESIWTSPQ